MVVRLIRSVYNETSISLIDVGCASGAFIYYAKTELNIQNCVGIDISDAHLTQARVYMPDVEFILDSISDPQYVAGREFEFDVCTCLGTMAIFDDILIPLVNLLALVKQGGVLYVLDLVNEYPVDVIMRYRLFQDDEHSEWRSGFNVRSSLLMRSPFGIDPNARLSWTDFEIPFSISQTADPLRAWTVRTEHKDYQIVVGTGQLLNFKVLQVLKA